MAYTKPELIDGGPSGDTVEDGIMKTDTNVDDIYAALNDLLSQIPDDLDPNAYYRVDGSNQLTANFQAGGFILRNVKSPLEDSDAATQGWSNSNFLSLSGGTVSGYIACSLMPSGPDDLANKAYVDAHGGGGGEGVWGSITGDITLQADLMTEFGKKADAGHGHLDATTTVAGFMSTADKAKLDDMADDALLMDFLAFSEGSASADHPIKLDDYGVLDVSFFSIKIFNLVGDWTPTPAEEYPSPAEPGDYWIIENVGAPGSGGYTFTGGVLDGRVIYDNELLVKGRDNKWGILHLRVDPNLYYRLDGTNHLTADFQAGNHRLTAVSDPIDNSDAVTKGWMNNQFLPLSGGTVTGHISCSLSPTDGDHLANKTYVDLQGGGDPPDLTDYARLDGAIFTGPVEVHNNFSVESGVAYFYNIPATGGVPTAPNHFATKEYVDDNAGGDPPVTSVNGETGDVVLDYNDVGAAASGHGHTEYLENTGGDMTGMIRMHGVSDDKVVLSSGGGSKTIDLQDGSFFSHSNGGSSSSYSMSVPAWAGQGLIFVIYLSGGGSRSFSNTAWIGGNAPDSSDGVAVIYTDSAGAGGWIGAWGSMS